MIQKFAGLANFMARATRNWLVRYPLGLLYWCTSLQTAGQFKAAFYANRELIYARVAVIAHIMTKGPLVRIDGARPGDVTAVLAYDAATGEREPPVLGAVLIREDHPPLAMRYEVTHPKATSWHIGLLEALARLIATTTFAKQLRDKSVVRVGDNAGVVYTTVPGSSLPKNPIHNYLNLAAHAADTATRASFVDRYIRSKENAADGPTRSDTMRKLRESMCATMTPPTRPPDSFFDLMDDAKKHRILDVFANLSALQCDKSDQDRLVAGIPLHTLWDTRYMAKNKGSGPAHVDAVLHENITGPYVADDLRRAVIKIRSRRAAEMGLPGALTLDPTACSRVAPKRGHGAGSDPGLPGPTKRACQEPR